jgi:hypothetical protein
MSGNGESNDLLAKILESIGRLEQSVVRLEQSVSTGFKDVNTRLDLIASLHGSKLLDLDARLRRVEGHLGFEPNEP